jgi:hypothetical protein
MKDEMFLIISYKRQALSSSLVNRITKRCSARPNVPFGTGGSDTCLPDRQTTEAE